MGGKGAMNWGIVEELLPNETLGQHGARLGDSRNVATDGDL